MKTTEMTITVLEAAQGEFLTQTNLEEGADRTFSTKVFLAKDASENDWRIATQEEKEVYDAQREKGMDNENHLQ